MYEPRYPRTPRVRWRYVLAKCGQGAISLVLAYAVFRQFVLPVLRETTAPPPTSSSLAAQPAGPLAALTAAALSLAAAQASERARECLERERAGMRVLAHRRLTHLPPSRSLPQARLAVPTLGVWLLLYLAAFHCGLNALAEVGASERERERERTRERERVGARTSALSSTLTQPPRAPSPHLSPARPLACAGAALRGPAVQP